MYKFKKGTGSSSSASSAAPGSSRPGMKFSTNVAIKPDEPGKVENVVRTEGSESDTAHPSHPQPPSKLSPRDSQSQKDLMISYSHADKDFMLKIRDTLEKNGISVWVDVSGLQAGVDFLSKIGEAIIDCKLFISLLSTSSVKSKYCQDELALAYVSNRAIFPLALDEPDELYPLMDTGMKLQLARYEWTLLGKDESSFEEKFTVLLDSMKEELMRQEEDVEGKNVEKDSEETKSRPKLERQQTRQNLNRKNKRQESTPRLAVESLEPDKYWKDMFGPKDEVQWEIFMEKFKKDFETPLSRMFCEKEEIDFLMGVLYREMEVEEGVLYKHDFMAFCNVEGNYYPLWERVDEQARESWSMKEVFDMESSVRVEAIENLGKFHSAAVIDALRDLLNDVDANVRAVAAVSLARTETNDPVTNKFLMKTLNDKDRLVREAGCLALGHLKVKQAVSKLLHLWRNDVISHVREAANVALNQIGGPEVEKQMKVTKVLADEIRQLTVS
ncbi:uncharacterized protein LOC101851332 [Aplysia californica]|uniref:Uncharacterized protein LOC101851332 n=1 Tax=Aplysia californica TaxID=6500 RepID=A0ABM0JGJ9_APLCA|nr:uncharacterized protein LOC101851332 [Aplysia californica]